MMTEHLSTELSAILASNAPLDLSDEVLQQLSLEVDLPPHPHLSHSDEDSKTDSRPCTVCKAVHLSCDRMRPCSRCVRLGREADCCDPPICKRGRPALSSKPKSKRNSDPTYRVGKRPHTIPSSRTQITKGPCSVDPAIERLVVYTDGFSIVGCSPEFASFMGYTQAEMIGAPCFTLHPPELRDPYRSFFFGYCRSVPPNIYEEQHTANLIVMTKTTCRRLVAVDAQLYLKSGAPTMGILTVTKVLIDNLDASFAAPHPFDTSQLLPMDSSTKSSSSSSTSSLGYAEQYSCKSTSTEATVPSPQSELRNSFSTFPPLLDNDLWLAISASCDSM